MIAGCVAILSGCATAQLERSVSLDFLEHAPVTREQVTALLGPSSASFESERVLTFRLRQNKSDYYLVRPAKGPRLTFRSQVLHSDCGRSPIYSGFL
jgi:hypothetical protein